MLPTNLSFNNNVESAPSRSFRTNIQAQTGSSFKPSETIIFNIPTRNNLIMSPSESYLRGKVTFKNGADASNYIRFDSNGAHGLIYRMQLYHGSNLLQTIENYGTLAKLLFDLQVSSASTNGKHSILAGTSTEYTKNLSNIVALASDVTLPNLVVGLKAQPNTSKYLNTGRRLNALGTQIAAAGTVSMDFCISLISLVGSLSPKFIPLFEMASAPLRLELQLVSNPLDAVISQKALATDGNGMVVSDIEFVASMMELSDSAVSIIKSNSGGRPLQYTFGDWRNYRWSSSISGRTNTQISMPVPAKYASLKSLFFCQKRNSATGVVDYFPYTSEKLYLQSYQVRCGAELLPSKPPTQVSEFFAETIRAIGSLSDLNHSPAIDFDTYNVDVQQATTETLSQAPHIGSSSFYTGIDLENYSGSDKSQLFSGKNTQSDDIFYNATFAGGSLLADSQIGITVDAMANYDSVIVFENGTAYVKY